MKAAIKDIRLAVNNDSFGILLRQDNDVLDETLHDIVFRTDVQIDQAAQSSPQPGGHGDHSAFSPDYANDGCGRTIPTVGDRLEVFSPGYNRYYAGIMDGVDGNARQVTYDNEDVENLALENEQ